MRKEVRLERTARLLRAQDERDETVGTAGGRIVGFDELEGGDQPFIEEGEGAVKVDDKKTKK